MSRAVAPAFRSVQMHGNHVDDGREQQDGEQGQVQDMPQPEQALVEHEGGALVDRGEVATKERAHGLAMSAAQAPRPAEPLGLGADMLFGYPAEPGVKADRRQAQA